MALRLSLMRTIMRREVGNRSSTCCATKKCSTAGKRRSKLKRK